MNSMQSPLMGRCLRVVSFLQERSRSRSRSAGRQKRPDFLVAVCGGGGKMGVDNYPADMNVSLFHGWF